MVTRPGAALPDPEGFDVHDGYVFVGRALGDRAEDGRTVAFGAMGLFSCESCGAVVADQALHTSWHEEGPQT